jgi:hypothetical protein
VMPGHPAAGAESVATPVGGHPVLDLATGILRMGRGPRVSNDVNRSNKWFWHEFREWRQIVARTGSVRRSGDLLPVVFPHLGGASAVRGRKSCSGGRNRPRLRFHEIRARTR